MSNLPANLPGLLRAAGLTVVEVDGWRGRGRPGSFNPVGVLNHHTGASANGWSKAKELAYARWMFITGRSDLPAPLCQISLGRSGVVYVGAAGRANHAGTAKASGSVAGGDGNSLYIGIEWMLSGTERIPAHMYAAGVTLNAVLTEHVTKTSVETISCHYQTSVTGKWDIGDPNGVPFHNVKVLDVKKFRGKVRDRRKALRKKVEGPKKMRVVFINVPRKVGQRSWETCFKRAYRRSVIFGINESLTKSQRDVYAKLTDELELGQYGLRQTPNPIFWRDKRFRKIDGKVHLIHPAANNALERKYPGFNAEREITEVVLRQRVDGKEFAILNSHFAPRGRKVDARWRKEVNRKSKDMVRTLVRKHQKAGREVIFGGDTNDFAPFSMPKGFRWYRGRGIDKIGGTLRGSAKTFPAPTDHKHGVQATVKL